MPKVSYSVEERKRIRDELLQASLELMSAQGIRHTTIEQVYKKVGISRTFFYTFFPTKEDLVVEMLYIQQPKIIRYVNELMADTSCYWENAVRKFFYTCCKGEKSGIAILSIEEQQMIFRRLSAESYKTFRKKQFSLFSKILESFGVSPDRKRVELFINLCLAMLVTIKAIPETMPLLVPEAVNDTMEFQINSIVDYLSRLRQEDGSILPERGRGM